MRLLFAVLALSLSVSFAFADVAEEEHGFVEHYVCPISQMLEMIRSTPPASSGDTDRFLILYRTDNPAAYAQCEFSDGDRKVYCEVASGFYENPKDAPRVHAVSGERLRSILALGYGPDDSKGNYSREFEVEDIGGLAEFMLRSLFEAFPGRPSLKIGYQAPLVPRRPPGLARL